MSKQGINSKNSKVNLKIHMESSQEQWTELYEKIAEICDYADKNGVDKALDKYERDDDASDAMLIYGSIEQGQSGQP
jgi:transcription elongation factor GreA-like protein|tara:strand:+ start:137 stop:367 length:231 start_codon:yes stop_codon:yes gene_type:complete